MKSRFLIAKSGSRIQNAGPKNTILDNIHPVPKINTGANPPHAGIIIMKWVSTTPIPNQTVKILDSFSHGYDYIPTVFASFDYDDGTNKLSATLPFLTVDNTFSFITIEATLRSINLIYYSNDTTGAVHITPFTMIIKYYVMAERGDL